MTELAKEVTQINIEDELKQSYLDYAMSVIVGRALPDVRDGLKPVHRRIIYAMHQLSNDWNKPYKKSARIVGDVIGKYHPHGDTAVYDSIVRMAQPFSMRNVLVDGQGNFGSIDGDPAAAMRYTEIRMSKLTHSLLQDIEKQTVDFVPNYDESELQPLVLPTRVPNLLVNGSSGIAVGMATNIPTHNLGEVIDTCVAYIDNSEITIEELIKYLPGPDFPTAATIMGRGGIIQAYKTGKGKVVIRSKTKIETDKNSGKESIVINELPYQVNKAKLIEKMAELVKEKKVEGISAIRDESDKEGIRVVIEIKRNENSEVILNNLYAQTPLQSSFGINMVALVDNQPRTLNLKEIIEAFVNHRRQVVFRRTVFELNKAQERCHILEGLSVALSNVDEIIELIKSSKTPNEAKNKLIENSFSAKIVIKMLQEVEVNTDNILDMYKLSDAQAQAILDLKLQKLTNLEHEKLISEFKEILIKIKELKEIINEPAKLMLVIRNELLDIKNEFADPRKTEISNESIDFNHEDLIDEEIRVVTLSNTGYAKTQPLSDYESQKRGGKGKIATNMKDEDFIDHLLIANSHDYILCFSSFGKVYWIKTYELPHASRQSRGKPINNILPLQNDEKINTLLALNTKIFEDPTQNIFMTTARGFVKQVPLSFFKKPRSTGLIAINLSEGDDLISACLNDGKNDVIIFSDNGKAVRFNPNAVRVSGRTSRGIRGIRLTEDSKVISSFIVNEGTEVLLAAENGFGKRTGEEEFPTKGRGTKGVIAIKTSERNGKLIKCSPVKEADEAILISDQGILVRLRVSEIAKLGRNTQGVRLIKLNQGDKLANVQAIDASLIEDIVN